MKHRYFLVAGCLFLIGLWGCSGTNFKGGKKDQPATSSSSSEESSEEFSSSEPEPEPGVERTLDVCVYYSSHDAGDDTTATCSSSDGSGANRASPCHHCDDTLNITVNGKSNTYNFRDSTMQHRVPGNVFTYKLSKDKFSIGASFKTKAQQCSKYQGTQLCRGTHIVVKIRAKVVKDGETTYSHYSSGSDHKVLTIGNSDSNKESLKVSEFSSDSSQYKFNVDGCN